MRFLLTFLLATVFSAAQAHAGTFVGDFVFVYVEHEADHALTCPPGCSAQHFCFPHEFIGDLRQKKAWEVFFSGNGVQFPKGGFVAYVPAKDLCYIATTPDELDLIMSLLAPHDSPYVKQPPYDRTVPKT